VHSLLLRADVSQAIVNAPDLKSPFSVRGPVPVGVLSLLLFAQYVVTNKGSELASLSQLVELTRLSLAVGKTAQKKQDNRIRIKTFTCEPKNEGLLTALLKTIAPVDENVPQERLRSVLEVRPERAVFAQAVHPDFAPSGTDQSGEGALGISARGWVPAWSASFC
jgi:hypothetical protein